MCFLFILRRNASFFLFFRLPWHASVCLVCLVWRKKQPGDCSRSLSRGLPMTCHPSLHRQLSSPLKTEGYMLRFLKSVGLKTNQNQHCTDPRARQKRLRSRHQLTNTKCERLAMRSTTNLRMTEPREAGAGSWRRHHTSRHQKHNVRRKTNLRFSSARGCNYHTAGCTFLWGGESEPSLYPSLTFRAMTFRRHCFYLAPLHTRKQHYTYTRESARHLQQPQLR